MRNMKIIALLLSVLLLVLTACGHAEGKTAAQGASAPAAAEEVRVVSPGSCCG